MVSTGTPIRVQTARLLGVKTSQGAGTLVLYPDKIVHVRSQTVLWASRIGLVDSITGIETRKSRGRRARRNLFVSTAGGADYGFSVKLDRWSTDLASALMARGCAVYPTLQGMAVTPAASAWGRAAGAGT